MMRSRFLQFSHGLSLACVVCVACVVSAAFAPQVQASTDSAAANSSASLVTFCDAPTHQTVLTRLSADVPRMEAHAVWANRQAIVLPGTNSASRYRLLFGRGESTQESIALAVSDSPLPTAAANALRYLGKVTTLSVPEMKTEKFAEMLRGEVMLIAEDANGKRVDATRVQQARLLDDIYSSATNRNDYGAVLANDKTQFTLWAPTATAVAVCVYASGTSRASSVHALHLEKTTGVWSLSRPQNLSGRYYTYLVDVHVPGVGLVRNRVTDPYSLSLTTNSTRSMIVDLNDAALKPTGWGNEADRARRKVKSSTDMVIYELHVRDFSINDASVPQKDRGKYTAFTYTQSRGMKHLKALADAGMTDVHLLPVFDIASIPEEGCLNPNIPHKGLTPDSDIPAEAVMQSRGQDCFNWGYDPQHYTAPEGSYATNAANGATRIREFREMVSAMHRIGLRVGMDVVYNHTSHAGQDAKSVLDRIVPGYYHRLNAKGEIERSTCCENTATEHAMMAKLMIDSAVVWARDYGIDGFRFDLMGHQPRAAMEELQRRVNAATGRTVQLIGEGWNFGEVENNARFVQASQLSLNGSGIGTFSDRARDAIRGGTATEGGKATVRHQGYVNGISYAPNAFQDGVDRREGLYRAADMVRVGLAGSIRDFTFKTWRDEMLPLSRIDYNGQPAGFVLAPGEVVNYVENHDNHTLFDINAFKLPTETSREDRARVQVLALAINMFSQGVAYFHAGGEILRSKSMDKNSYDSGDWFNRIDWTLADNYFATGMPLKSDNTGEGEWIHPLLRNPNIKPSTKEIRWTNAVFQDLLKIRASTPLFRLRTAEEIQQRLKFYNVGAKQIPTVIVGHLDGRGYAGGNFDDVVYLINVGLQTKTLAIAELRGKALALHPVQANAKAGDQRVKRDAKWNAAQGVFVIPARSAVVFVAK
jgi:pullulanase